MLKIIALISVMGMSGTALAETLSCRANVALNRVYQISIDEQSNVMHVENDAGTTFDGVASRYVSGRSGNVTWYLATGFKSGVEVERENGGAGRIAFCLADNECYLCR